MTTNEELDDSFPNDTPAESATSAHESIADESAEPSGLESEFQSEIGSTTESKQDSNLTIKSAVIQWIGVAVIFGFAVWPDLMNALEPIVQSTEIMTIAHIGESIIGRAVVVSLILFFVMVVTRTAWSSIGMGAIRWQDPLWGILIWFLGTVGYYAIVYPLFWAGLGASGYFAKVETVSTLEHYQWIIALSIANGFAEEVIVRGYLLTRFEKLINSTWLAVLISTAMFASYHIYQGIGPTIAIGAIGLIYGVAYCKLRRIWPLVIAHAITDFVGFLSI